MKSNFYDEMSVDEILNDVKRMNNEKEETGRIWSLDEIDALLGDEADSEDAELSCEDMGRLLDAYGISDYRQESYEYDANAPEQADTAGTADTAESETASDDFSYVAPLIDSAVVPEYEATEADEKESALREVPGQITIEKTRVFNEVETRAVRKDDIEHNIGKSKVIRTGEIPKGRMEADPYRERFFNQPKIRLENTLEHLNATKTLPQKTIEKHGVVVKKPSNEKTGEDGLSPVPILVDAADEFEAQQLVPDIQSGELDSGRLGENEFDNQIMLDGFNKDEEPVEIVNEAEEEAKLRRARRERASKFKLFPNLDYDISEDGADPYAENPDAEADGLDKNINALQNENNFEDIETAEEAERQAREETQGTEKSEPEREEIRIARDFYGPKDAKAVHAVYTKELREAKIKLIVSAAGFAFLLICSVITSVFSNFSLFANSPYVFCAINLLVLAAVGAVNFKAFPRAVQRIKKKKADSAVALSLAIVIGIFQCAVSFAYGDLVLSGMHIYAPVALFVVMFLNIGEYIKLDTDFTNFVLLNNERDGFYAIKSIDDDDVAFEVGRGLMIKEPDIRYRAKVGFPYKFVEMSRIADPTADMFGLVVPVALIACVIVGFISSIINKNIFSGISALTGVYLMAVPSAAFVSLFFNFKEANKRLNDGKSMISGYEAVEDALNTNAVLVDSLDMFNNDKTNIYGIKLYNSMRIDEAILYTAAVIIQSGGALSEVFDSVILENRDMLPSVESLAYEEKLGCSGWIYNYRVLVGSRDLLVKHNVEVQSKEEERKFTKRGKQVVYLAVEGKIAAMFVVGYGVDEDMAHYFRALERAGVNILVKTSDANITESFIEQYFGLPRNYIKIVSPVAGLMFKEYSEKETEKEPCRILSDGKMKTSLRALLAAFVLNEQKNISTVLQYVGVGIGILLMAMFAFIAGLNQAGVLQMVLFEALWSLIVIFVPQLVKKV